RRVAPGRRDPRAPPCGAARARAVPRSGPAARAGRGSSPPEMSSPGVRLPNRTTYRPEEYGGRYAGQVASPDPGKEARKPHALSCARLLRGARPPGGARPRHASPGGAVPRPRVLGRAVRHREREPGRPRLPHGLVLRDRQGPGWGRVQNLDRGRTPAGGLRRAARLPPLPVRELARGVRSRGPRESERPRLAHELRPA